jgi:hypothetical protein
VLTCREVAGKKSGKHEVEEKMSLKDMSIHPPDMSIHPPDMSIHQNSPPDVSIHQQVVIFNSEC